LKIFSKIFQTSKTFETSKPADHAAEPSIQTILNPEPPEPANCAATKNHTASSRFALSHNAIRTHLPDVNLFETNAFNKPELPGKPDFVSTRLRVNPKVLCCKEAEL